MRWRNDFLIGSLVIGSLVIGLGHFFIRHGEQRTGSSKPKMKNGRRKTIAH